VSGGRWGVVGGGFLGMTLAHRLAQAGGSVTLFEASRELGGLAAPWRLGDVEWDRHYHVTLLSDLRLRALLAELDLEREMEWSFTRTGFFTDGRLLSLSNSLEFLRFPPLRLLDKARLAATILHAARVKDWRGMERVSVESWLRRWSGDRTFERIWLPLLRSKLGESYRETSAAFIWATIARMYEARRSGLKKEMFGYVPGSYGRILRRFQEVLEGEGVRLHPGTPVTRVEKNGSGMAVESVAGTHKFDQVVLTVPLPLVTALCPGLSAEERARYDAVRYQGIVCASLLLDQPLSPYYVTNITEPDIPFTAVVEMSNVVDRRHFGGRHLVYLPKYAAADEPIFAKSDEEIRREFLAALVRMHPALDPARVLAFQVSRVKHVFALPTLRYSERLPPPATSEPGLHVVSSAHILNNTLNVNATVKLAEAASAALLSAESRTNLPAF